MSYWLIEEGCLYAMAWGRDCSLWDESLDYALIEKFSPGEIPDERFVVTTWHENESLSEALSFAKFDATESYTGKRLDTLLVLDISDSAREAFIRAKYEKIM